MLLLSNVLEWSGSRLPPLPNCILTAELVLPPRMSALMFWLAFFKMSFCSWISDNANGVVDASFWLFITNVFVTVQAALSSNRDEDNEARSWFVSLQCSFPFLTASVLGFIGSCCLILLCWKYGSLDALKSECLLCLPASAATVSVTAYLLYPFAHRSCWTLCTSMSQGFT